MYVCMLVIVVRCMHVYAFKLLATFLYGPMAGDLAQDADQHVRDRQRRDDDEEHEDDGELQPGLTSTGNSVQAWTTTTTTTTNATTATHTHTHISTTTM